MRFIVRQKVFSFGDNFTIKDETGNEHFIVRGKVFALSDKLRIYNMQGQELFILSKSCFGFCPSIPYTNQDNLWQLLKTVYVFKPRFNIWSAYGDFTIEGNFLGMDFSIYNNGKHVAQVSKRWFSWGDTYGVDIADDENYGFLLALVIVIDQVIHDNNHNNS